MRKSKMRIRLEVKDYREDQPTVPANYRLTAIARVLGRKMEAGFILSAELVRLAQEDQTFRANLARLVAAAYQRILAENVEYVNLDELKI